MNQNLDDLRKEYKELSDYSVRVGVVFLTILSLLVISFTRAWNRVQSADVAEALCKIQKANALSQQAANEDENVSCPIQLSYIFGDVDDHKSSCQWPCADVTDPIGDPVAVYLWDTTDKLKLDYPKLKRSCDCQRKLERDLETQAEGWFQVKAPIPGMDTNIDLRYWMALFPIGFILSGLYLFILRKKQMVLSVTASKRMKDLDPDQITRLDHMYFESDSAYTTFPSSITYLLFVLCYLFLPLYLVYVTVYPGSHRGLDVTDGFSFILPLLFYAIAYGYYVSRRFDEQISKITEGQTPTNKFRSGLAAISGWIGRVAQRVSPRVTLIVGATLILLSLFGRIGGLGNFITVGYQFVLQPDRQHPFPSLGIYQGPRIDWAIYVSLLALSILVILFVLFPRLYRMLDRNGARTILVGLAGAGFVINLIAFSSTGIDRIVDLDYSYYLILKGVLLALTLGVWFWVVRSLSQDASVRKKRIWTGLIVVYFPFFVFALMEVFRPPYQSSFAALLFPNRLAYGVVALFLGTFVMALGGIHSEYRSRDRKEFLSQS